MARGRPPSRSIGSPVISLSVSIPSQAFCSQPSVPMLFTLYFGYGLGLLAGSILQYSIVRIFRCPEILLYVLFVQRIVLYRSSNNISIFPI